MSSSSDSEVEQPNQKIQKKGNVVSKKKVGKKSPRKSKSNTEPEIKSPGRKSPMRKSVKKLARTASKKNVLEGEVDGARKEKALCIEEEDLNLEQNLKHFQMILEECKKQEIPEHEVQRFLSKILATVKEAGFLVGVDTAVFKFESDHIRVLEASLNGSKMDWSVKKRLLDNLLNLALPEGLNTELLDQSREGMSWVLRNDLIPTESRATNTDNPKMVDKMVDTQDNDLEKESEKQLQLHHYQGKYFILNTW